MPNDGRCIWNYGNNKKCNHTKCQDCPVYDEFREMLEDLRMEQMEQM